MVAEHTEKRRQKQKKVRPSRVNSHKSVSAQDFILLHFHFRSATVFFIVVLNCLKHALKRTVVSVGFLQLLSFFSVHRWKARSLDATFG